MCKFKQLLIVYSHRQVHKFYIMKNIFLIAGFISVLSFWGCGKHSHDADTHTHDVHVHEHEHPVFHMTEYTDSLELFAEVEQLMAGHQSHVTLYVTELSDFKPVSTPTINIALEVAGNKQSLSVKAVHKGMYEFALSPKIAGEGTLSCVIGNETVLLPVHVSADCNHEHEHTHSHEADIQHNHDEHAVSNTISFLKEQSWKVDFSTTTVKRSNFNGAVKVAAKVTSTPNNSTTVVATSAGKVKYAGNVVAGKEVRTGESLFVLEGSDVTENDAAVKFAEAESSYLLAKANYERKQLLYSEHIVSESDFLQAQAALRIAEANYNSMKRSFTGDKVLLKSSVDGYISELLVANGDYVAAGTPLAALQCEGEVNLTAELPMRFSSVLEGISNVNIELTDGRVYSLDEINGRVVAVGRSANSCSMIPLTVSAKALQGVMPGSIVTLHIASSLDAGKEHPVVPRSALIEEMGNYFVFVQINPVTFEKREVHIGATDGKNTQIVEGLHDGERIVTKGAMSLKLSQGAAALDPHAGHVH